ncbi:mitochondrial-processing peptidase-like protein subunit alpha [Aaosphaeria arxii CBS 175.79]|uniref:Mitochondrial-processing peptidase subunit alpha n=1 Tax=Aaosphaeria arxii CBS 175.79 TaxID=1450172 RepID=A0A6A5XEG4_9PLEO|nr:mitochondrial-processing peptidase-like protein subunit alpha [Aaosphaeria arxii CBS 175.79]KAF2011261.1 mitochondrial-processing peptidase-like protein subunit alpha [Aaosphaeria arxii CBS 175.79]
MLRPRTIRPLSRSIRNTTQRAAACQSRRGLATTVAEEQDPVDLDQLTTLPNGIRVATEALPGPFSGVGVYVDAGSRFENDALRGVSHIIDRLAFKSTKSTSGDQMIEKMESLGGNIQCASSRESLMYQSASFNSAVPTTIGILAETIRDPLITEDEVQQQLETADYEIGEIWSKPELILPELVHMAAYKDNTLGHPLLCPKERLPFINRQVVEAYRKEFYKPERMVVAFAGVNHNEAVRLTQEYFGDMQKGTGPALVSPSQDSTISSSAPYEHTFTASHPTPMGAPPQSSKLLSKIPFFKNLSTSATSQASVQTSLDLNFPPIDTSTPSHYTGGFLTLPPIPPPANPALPRLSHIHLAFEALPINSPDIYALATLQTLLGGGGSFSAGGPGKGMYSRLYTNVLNQHGWVESCIAFNHSYTDSGLFGIAASCAPALVAQMLEVMCRELVSLSDETGYAALKEGEVQRAKNQLRSSLLMNLESRMVELEDLGRQVQVHGRKVGVKEMCKKIEAVTVKDLRRVAREVFGGQVQNLGGGSGAPTVVLQEGEQEGLNRKDFQWDDIQARIARWQLGRR